jgi:hypothetical protein
MHARICFGPLPADLLIVSFIFYLFLQLRHAGRVIAGAGFGFLAVRPREKGTQTIKETGVYEWKSLHSPRGWNGKSGRRSDGDAAGAPQQDHTWEQGPDAVSDVEDDAQGRTKRKSACACEGEE